LFLEAKDLVYHYPEQSNSVVLDGCSLTVNKGEICSVIGPSGCGKTSLLYLIAGLFSPTKGQVMINNETVCAGRKETAIILQDYGLLPWKTVWENIALGLRFRGVNASTIEEQISSVLQQVELEGVEDRYPTQLSGGQQQRVAIARSLVLHPDLLLMDESFSALDAITREKLQNLLIELWYKHRFAVLLVTHSVEEACFLGQKIVVMSQSPSRVVHTFIHEGDKDPEYRYSAKFHELCTSVRKQLKGEIRAYA